MFSCQCIMVTEKFGNAGCLLHCRLFIDIYYHKNWLGMNRTNFELRRLLFVIKILFDYE